MQTQPLESSVRRAPPMRVTKRNGDHEPVDVNKIVRAIKRNCHDLLAIDPMRIATQTISGLYDGATTRELDELSIRTSAALIMEEPQYDALAARLLATYIGKEVQRQEIQAFSQSVREGEKLGILQPSLGVFVQNNARKLNDAICPERDRKFGYFGLRTLYDRYLLKRPKERTVFESPQYFFMRIACALGAPGIEDRNQNNGSMRRVLALYTLFSNLDFLPSSPTLFNAGTRHPQLSSCFLMDSPRDNLADIYRTYADIAMLSKFSGGIGLAFHRVRSRGSLIASTNGHSSGIVPWLKTLDSSVAAVNQGGKRKGACSVYLEPWHADVEDFLALRDNTGDHASRTHNLNLANWIPDLFMKRVETDALWSLFDPKDVPTLPDLYGEAFEDAYHVAENQGLSVRTLPARALYRTMMRTLAQTGNGWMTFKDKSNVACNQTGKPGQTVHLSNLCTEILEVSSAGETAVCNLGSINLAHHVLGDSFDFDKLQRTVATAVRMLDQVIDINLYAIPSTHTSNQRWRPVGLGLMGLQDVFFRLGLAFDSDAAQTLSSAISESIYFHALSTSVELAETLGRHPAFSDTRASQGELQFDAWNVAPSAAFDWAGLRTRIQKSGLRNSLLIAIAPTATIASIAGCYECIEPQISNLFKRETLSGDFLQVNTYLVHELQALGLWNDATRDRLKMAEGSVQGFSELPESLRTRFRTSWEIPMRSLIDMAAARGPFIDQSQSLNLFVESPDIAQLSSMYFYAWKQGLKTTYYLRSRPATRIAKTTVSAAAQTFESKGHRSQADVLCSLENPETCEACQ